MTLTDETTALEAEAVIVHRLTAARLAAGPTYRTPLPHEVRARVRFGNLDRIIAETTHRAATHADTVRDAILDDLAQALTGDALELSADDALNHLTALADPTNPTALPSAREAIAHAEHAVTDALNTAAEQAAAEAVDEAARQGVPHHVIPPIRDDLNRVVKARLQAEARTVATAPARRLLDVALDAARTTATGDPAITGADVLLAALDAAESASTDGITDQARQAANIAHGLGRTAQLQTFPPPREVYASELLDTATCGPCASVDGRTYESMSEALRDYPGAGGYIGCQGGARCRGTLVIVHDTEAAPTVSALPGEKPPPVHPQKATGATLPAHIDELGRVIPLAPRDWRPPLDDDEPISDEDAYHLAARTAPTPQPATSDNDLDPDFADYTDTDLADALDGATKAAAEGDADAAEMAAAYARELESRAQLRKRGGKVPDPDRAPDPDEGPTPYRARADAATKPRGRLRDRVGAEWQAEVLRHADDAETATRGYLIRQDRAAEFARKYGNNTAALFEGPARVAYYYASPELREWWSTNTRMTRAEYFVQRGITDAKTTREAAAARIARQAAEAAADEDRELRRKRQQQAAAARRRKRGPKSEGEKAAAARDRLERARRRTGEDTP